MFLSYGGTKYLLYSPIDEQIPPTVGMTKMERFSYNNKNMKFSFKFSTSGFTLVEMMIAMTIFAMMSTMVMTIYFSTTNTTRKLNAQREISETAREITERLASDIREYGFSGTAVEFFPSSPHDPWRKNDYIGSGSEYLNLGNGRYVYGNKTAGGMVPCIDVGMDKRKSSAKIHCGLYLVKYSDNGVNAYNLVDSFNPDEKKKRVKISNLRFYLSGDGVGTSRKVMLNMDLVLMPRGGLSELFTSTSTLHIQTTMSERLWKK